MQIRNALGRIDHREVRASSERSVNGGLDFGFLRIAFQALVQVAEAVIRIDTEFLEQVGVLHEHILEEHAHKGTEQHRVGDLHHRGLQVHGEEEALGLGFSHGIGNKLFEGGHAHHGRIDDFTLEERLGGTEFRHGTSFVDEFNLERIGLGHRDGLFVAVEVIRLHARHMSLHGFVPVTVAMRIVAGIVLHGIGGAAVGIALTEHRVHGRALHLVVLGADSLLFVRGRSVRIIGDVKAVLLEFGNRSLELRHRGRNVRKLDDVRIRFKRKLAQECEVVVGLAESSQNAARQGNILGFHIDISRLRKSAHDGQQGLSGQERRLVRKGVIDFSIHTP